MALSDAGLPGTTLVRRIWHSRYFFWALLAVPSIPLFSGLFYGTMRYGAFMHVSGEFSVRFLVLALAISPFATIFEGARWPRWLMRRRRYIGLAAFGYGALHTLVYVMNVGSIAQVLGEFWRVKILTGWVVFLVFAPLAVTSNNFSVRKLARHWKSLQRLVYLAAFFTALHWYFIHWEISGTASYFVPLAVLEVLRTHKNWRQSRTPRDQS